MTPNKRRWNEIDALLQHFEPNEMRKFMAASLKFLIPPSYWTADRPVCPFDSEDEIQAFHSGFETFKAEEMRGQHKLPEEDQVFMRLIRLAANPSSRTWSRRTAKRKTTKLRREMQKRFLRYQPFQSKPLRGVRYYEGLIRKNFVS